MALTVNNYYLISAPTGLNPSMQQLVNLIVGETDTFYKFDAIGWIAMTQFEEQFTVQSDCGTNPPA